MFPRAVNHAWPSPGLPQSLRLSLIHRIITLRSVIVGLVSEHLGVVVSNAPLSESVVYIAVVIFRCCIPSIQGTAPALLWTRV